MRLETVESPRILPGCVSCVSARMIDGRISDYFGAGRHCARQAIARLGLPSPAEIPRGPAGEPLWPEGVTGSITHKDGLFVAAVAKTADLRSLGIDLETVIGPERAAAVAKTIVLPQEHAIGGDTLDATSRVIVVFSIKEAVFKCLFPLVQRRFYYDAFEVTDIDTDASTFTGRLLAGLSADFPAGYALTGRVEAEGGRVISAAWLDR